MNSETKYYVIPEFSGANIPVNEAAHIMKKDPQFIRQGMIQGVCILQPQSVTKCKAKM